MASSRLLLVLLAFCACAQALTIDDLTTNQPLFSTGPSSTSATVVPGSIILGGDREIELVNLASIGTLSGEVSGLLFTVTHTDPSPGQSAGKMRWDGTGNPAGSVELGLLTDLTVGGATAFQFTGTSTVAYLVSMRAWTGTGTADADACTTQQLGIPGTTPFVFAYTSFPDPISGVCDFTGVKALQITIQLLGAGTASIGAIVTDGAPCNDADNPPVLAGCLADPRTLNTDPGVCCAVDTFSVTATDPDGCAVLTGPTQTAGSGSGSCFADGATVTWGVSDSGGNIDSCSWTYNIVDNQNPTFTACPSNINVGNDAGVCGAAVSYTATSSDNCGATDSLTSGQASGTTFPVGSTPTSITATDGAGNTATCGFTVSVTDTENPSFSTCPSNINTGTDAGVCTAVVTYSTVSGDNCAVISGGQNAGLPSGSPFPLGPTLNDFIAIDAAGNSGSCSFTVTVNDDESPSYTGCPPDPTVLPNDAGQCSAVFSFSPSANDNCGVTSDTQTAGLSSGSAFPVGSTTNTFTASDAAGNTAGCQFVVGVQDVEDPSITCPSSFSVNNDAGACSAVVTYSLPTSDNCAVVSTPVLQGGPSGSTFNVGTTNVVRGAFDAAGNSATCGFTVTVNDAEAPSVDFCPGPISTNNDAGQCSAVVGFTVIFSDNCPGLTSSQPLGLPSGSAFPVGVTNNQVTATDSAGASSSCAFPVTVIDVDSPTFTSGCSNIVRSTDLNQCSAAVSFSPSASDNCGVVSNTQTAGPPSGSSFPTGTTSVAFQAFDAQGNSGSCSFSVTVDDNQNPTVSCPSPAPVNNVPGTCAAPVSFSVSGSDNCPGVSVNQLSGQASGSSFPVGSTSNSFRAVDGDGNLSSTCSFNVVVLDNESPTVTCPADITVNNTPGLCSAPVTYTVLRTDNCAGHSLNLLGGLASGSSFPGGTTVVTYQAVDASGNTSPPCSFNVIVNDVEAPTITCPSDITVNANAAGCAAVVNFSYLTSDNCPGSLTVSSSHPSGSSFIGVTTVTGTVTDIGGNSASCSFTITVVDDVPPTIDCYDATANTAPGTCQATVFFRDPDAFDVCGVDIVRVGSAVSGNTYGPGVYQSTFTATDPSGNFDNCVSTIRVFDLEPPVVTGCPADIEVTNPSGCDEPVTWDDSSVSRTDNCGVVSSSQSHSPGATFPRGLTTVTYSARDAANNVGQCSFIVRVIDSQRISFTGCPSDMTVPSSCSDSGTAVSWQEPTISADECLSYQSRNFAPGARLPDGVTTISYVAVADEEWATCLFDVTVEPCPAENGANRPPGAIGTIDLDGDGYYSDAPLIEWRDCCDSPEDLCDDPFLVNPGAFEIAANDQQDSCRGIGEVNTDADGHIGGCDHQFVFANDFQLVGPLIPSEQTEEAVWAMDLCEFRADDDDPSWGFNEQQTMVFTLANGTRNGYDIGIVGPASTQAAVLDHYGGIVPARGNFMLAISSGTARDETTGGHQSPSGATTGNTIVNLPASFLDSNAGAFIEDCGTEPYAVGVDSIRAHFRMKQPTNMNAFSFQALYMDFELEASQGSYPAVGTCDNDRKSWFLAIKSDSKTGVSGNFAGDATGRSFNSFNTNPGFWSQCNDYGDFADGLCRDGATNLELTGFTGASNWTPIGTSAEPGESFTLEFVTFDGRDGANDVTVLIDDFFPITEARTTGSSTWASQPWGYQYTADLQMVHLALAGGSPLLSKTASSATLDFTIRNWGPEEANDVTIVFTPPLGARFTAGKDASGNSLNCFTAAASAAPYADNSLMKCKWRSNDPLADQATLSGSLAFALDLDCAACPRHTEEMRFRVTTTHSSIDRQLSNNYLTTDVVFV